MMFKIGRAASALLIAIFTCIVPAVARTLTFEERVRAQAAIESVYYSHQIGAARPFEQAAPRRVLEEKVRAYLKQSLALEKLWNTPVTDEMLRAELERMARQTRMPDRLRELYSALGNDSVLVRECLARPALVNRLSRSFFAHDATIHAEARRAAERLRDRLADGRIDPSVAHPDRTVVDYLRRDPEAGPALAVEPEGGIRVVELPADEFDRLGSSAPEKIGEAGPLEEDEERFLVRVTLERRPDRLRLAIFAIDKRRWDEWWREAAGPLDEKSVAVASTTPFALPMPASGPACPNYAWSNGSLDDTPLARKWHVSVWTGSRMIIWGGETPGNTGALYDPATDTWTPTSRINAPDHRLWSVAVWSGSEMLVWGGYNSNYLNTGGRYDPVADAWTSTSTIGAPTPRGQNAVVWTGKEMLVWGGSIDIGATASGGRYDPATDTWKPTSLLGAPSPRTGATAVWTGSVMVVWGGTADATGGRYDPATDTWAPTSLLNAPTGRSGQSAIWTGSEMLVWGGVFGTQYFNSGGRYDPAGDSWAPMSAVNAPAGRSTATAVWTGSVMVVWGGYGGSNVNTGGRYDPGTDTWSATSTLSAPTGRNFHTAIWTGSQMIVWGGWNQSLFFNTGGRYDPVADTWTPTSTGGAPTGRSGHVAVWTGSVMIVWGGSNGPYINTGGRYDPATDSWMPTSTANVPPAHGGYTAVWSGSEMIVWGGSNANGTVFYANGALYDPIGDTWRHMLGGTGPQARTRHIAVWAGSQMVVWGGYYSIPQLGQFILDSGGRYDPVTDTWTPTSRLNAPPPSYDATAVWTGSTVIVWGGTGGSAGGRYDPSTDTWTPTTTTNAPPDWVRASAIWTGSRMVVWGGNAVCCLVNTGGRYDPVGDRWEPTSVADAPTPREGHAAVWTGREMLIWGADPSAASSGGRYDPVADTWVPISRTNAPPGNLGMTAVWDGDSMVVWGGNANQPGVDFNTGGRYCACVATRYYLDADGDGYGDPANSNQFCGQPAGYVTTGGDCNDADPGLWGTPSEVGDLSLGDPVTISWQPPASPGGVNVRYDLIRSGNPADFASGAASCIVTDGPDIFATDAEEPAPGGVFAYLVRGRNDCLDGRGPLGTDSNGTPRVGRICP